MKNVNKIDKLIKNTLYGLLKEQSEEESEKESAAPKAQKPTGSNAGVISTTGAFGTGGRSKKFVASAGARAEEDPEGLLNDLGVYRRVTGKDLEAVLEVLRKAIHSNIVMSEAYAGAKLSSEKIENKQGSEVKQVISVTMKDLDRKNGVRFLAHTLEAAKNANYLNLDIGLQFGQSAESDIVIYAF